MQRQLSNVSFHSYQDYQPSRKYGPQYEPGGYAAAVQQRSNMTQREDALKFEQGRIKALQEERLHIQKKTFTKWMNSFLQKARMEVEDLFVDLADGRRLLKLLEIISGERLPRPNSGRMRVHKIENVNKSLSFLHTKVRLESIGAEDIVDGNPRLILGLIWTIILRFQIQEIEIDVDEENESSEKKSAKDALLLWCQRKTSGYHGVHIHNFTDSWRSGLGFNALIHAHRPELFRWSDLPVSEPVETLNHAFDVAHKHLGIPKLLDAEDVDTVRPDEKSVMTYVASYYHTFARIKNEQKSGRRIANIIGQLVDCDTRKAEYSRLISDLLEWIRLKIQELNDRQLPNSLDGIQTLLLAFKEYRTVEKPPKYKERSEIEALLFSISTLQKSIAGESWAPPDGQTPHDLQRAWQRLEQAEHAREIALRTELLRQQRLEQLNYKFNTKSVLRKGYLKEMIVVLSDPRYGSNLAQVDATVKKHEAISADILARTERFDDLSAMAAELVKENYHGAEEVSKTEQSVLQRWRELLELLEKHRQSLAALARLMALVRESDTVMDTVQDLKAQFESEETGRHLSDVERLLQAHALRELQLGALHDTIRHLLRQGSTAEGPAQPKKQLSDQLKNLEDEYDSLVAAAKDRKARLENARNLFQFLEDHDEEEAWVTEKQRICRAEVAAKDLRGVLLLRQKHAALMHELKAKEHGTNRHIAKGQSLIECGAAGAAEVPRRLECLQQQWAELRAAADLRQAALAAAADAYQFYGDANEAESWMKERRPLLASRDCGGDEPTASALLTRHKALHEETVAYRAELQTLKDHADALVAQGILQLQLPTEVESTPAVEESEWVNETRLVPTEVWEEEPVERLEHTTVTEQRSVPQVKALYPFTGQGISIAKGEVMFLISKSNRDWWSVRKADRTDGFVPANYVREIEPRTVPVQVRRPEKVRSVQRVKKTVLVKQVVPTRRAAAAAARPRRVAATHAQPSVPAKMKELHDSYEELLTLSAARRLELEDAIKLFSLYGECEELDKWIREKEKMLREEAAPNSVESVETAKRKYEKFVTDLLAASKRLEHIDTGVDNLIKGGHSAANKAAARRDQLKEMWAKLWQLKAERELSLHTASSVELFSRTCAEALDWMSEKQQQLQQQQPGNMPSSDLRTVQALQRRHAQLERELEPLREKVRTVNLLADSVKSQYPNEKQNVEARQAEISAMWRQCQQEAAERRRRLESAVGHQVFSNGRATLLDWTQKVREQIAQEVHAKDVATAESSHKQHQDIKDDIKAHDDEFKEVIGLGRQLLSSNPGLKDVAEKIKELEEAKSVIEKEWSEKDTYLKQCVELAMFYREADQIDARSGAHEAYLDCTDTGSTVDEVLALIKRHEELESRLAAQDERVAAFTQLLNKPHYAADSIAARKKQVLTRRDAVRQRASERRRALQASLAHAQLCESAEAAAAWMHDKARPATEPSYRDLANLERKLQKHEAFMRELQANEKQIRNIESVAESLKKSDPSRAKQTEKCVQKLRKQWSELSAAAKDKDGKLRQARAQREHNRCIEDVKARLAELERQLASEETGADLRSCRRLINQHQALELELSSCAQKAESILTAGQELVSMGHFDAESIQNAGKALVAAVDALKGPADRRKKALEVSMQYHNFASEVSNELSWLSEHRPKSDSDPSSLHAAQTAVKKHAKLKAELSGRAGRVKGLVDKGKLLAEQHTHKDQIKSLTSSLEQTYASVTEAVDARGLKLEAQLKAQQLLHDATEVESWLADKEATLGDGRVARDRHSATRLLAKHKATELELDTYDSIISEMKHSAVGMGAPLVQRCTSLQDTLARIRKKASQRQQALLHSLARHEYLAESAELEEWIQEQFVAASSEDYGQDYEHLLILQSKFEELRHRIESGAERFNQCEESAKKLLASDSPYIPDIEKRQEALGVAWQKLVEQVQSRAAKLRAASDIHRFHRDVAEFISRAAEKQAQLSVSGDLPASALRARDNLDSELLAIDAQLQVLVDEGSRLQSLYPGDNSSQIELEMRALQAARDALRHATVARREQLHDARRVHLLMTQIRDLISWSSSLRASMSAAINPRSPSAAQLMRGEHLAIKAEMDARDPVFRDTLATGGQLVAGGHPKSQEIEEKCDALLEERNRLHATWGARQVALDQLIDLQCFLRDSSQLHDLCAAQKAALSTEISPTASVEEVDNQLKKHEAFEKLLVTQDERLATLNSHGDKLLQQKHVESPRIADELKVINQKRKEIHELSQQRKDHLKRALTRAQFSRDVAEAKIWISDKMKNLQADQKTGEVSSLEDKIKKLQKHQAFKAELVANEARIVEIEALAKQLGDDDVKLVLNQLKNDWKELLEATEQKGRGLEEAQDILEFNQHLDKIEAWIRDKDMMVQAHELGRDYEHCSALLRKLDDVDSDMQVDDKHLKSVTALAEKLLRQGPTQQAASVASRRDSVVNKWKELTGALSTYRNNLTTALEMHAYNRDIQDTQDRIATKSALFQHGGKGNSLSHSHNLLRRHEALWSEASAIADKIEELAARGRDVAKLHPERAEEIGSSLQQLRENWERLKQLAAERSALLEDALAEHKFDESLKELEVWVSESVKRMRATAAAADAPLDAELLAHHEVKAEIDGRQKSIAALQKQAETQLADNVNLPEKLAKLTQLSNTLDEAWAERKSYLTQAHQLQQLKEQAQSVEDWIVAKEAVLHNDDKGDDMDAVDALIRKHTEFAKLMESQFGRINELKQFADTLLGEGHSAADYIKTRVKDIEGRGQKLKESCVHRGEILQQSRRLHQFLQDLRHEMEWIALKMQAPDQNFRELSNLQSKIQKQAAFESELAANKGRIDDVVNTGEELIESNHYATKEIGRHIEELENQWRELQATAKLRRDRLQEAYQARVYFRGLDDFVSWLDDVESQLFSEDIGKDLPSVSALLKRHSHLEQQMALKSSTVTQLLDEAAQLNEAKHFMAESIMSAANEAADRYRQLQEPMQSRRENLEDAAVLHRWNRDAEEEMRWLQERESLVVPFDTSLSLAQAQVAQKKYLALEAEISARSRSVSTLIEQAHSLSRSGHYAADILENQAAILNNKARSLQNAAVANSQAAGKHIERAMLLSELTEALIYLQERLPALTTTDYGKDEDTVISLQRSLEAKQRELQAFDATVQKTEKTADGLLGSDRNAPENEAITSKLNEIKQLYEEMKLLSAKRERRLEHSLKYFKFAVEVQSVEAWLSGCLATAASEDYGVDAEHVDALRQQFDAFYADATANEGQIESVCEAGQALIEENSPESERVSQKIDDIRGLWEDLKELAAARKEALDGARQVHEFDRAADETISWIAEKQLLLGSEGSKHEIHVRRRRMEALKADMDAIRAAYNELKERADKLSQSFPDAREHITSKLDDVTESLESVTSAAERSTTEILQAEHTRAYFSAAQELMAWCNETLARVTAPELAKDVPAAERLANRHKDIHTEIQAKDEQFQQLYSDGEKLLQEGHFMSSEISDKMAALRSRRHLLDETWKRRAEIYAQHLDALMFIRDADALDSWIAKRVPLVRDNKLGDSVSQVEELINRHRDLEETIDAQRERFLTLKRITLIEQSFKAQQEAEENERRLSEERQEAERMEQYKQQEIKRIADERRRHAPQREESLTSTQSTEETLSPAPQFDKLPKTDSAVKRAESMQVVKTPKRTPSFTTRRRTQSFRRQRPDQAPLPPVEIQGTLSRKQTLGSRGSRVALRSWRPLYAVLCGQLLCFFRDHDDFLNARAHAPPIAIHRAHCEPAEDYTKRSHVFRLSCADGAEYLFACPNASVMQDWVNKINFHAQLPPQLQLTKYDDTEVRSRLQQNSTSPSPTSSPEPRRSQADILNTARNIESTVLPSLPPRQPDGQSRDDAADVMLRASEPGWGRTRFSNGRDVNAEFIRSQQEAYGAGGGGGGGRPASVAGSGGSPALDQRPASRSSGESELSLSGNPKDKKDKKGVFGGLFSRKKRPQSHM